MDKLFRSLLMATIVSFISPVCLATYYCSIHFFSHQINITIQPKTSRNYLVTDQHSGDQVSCKKVREESIPQEFLPEGGGKIVLALYCRVGMFPSYYLFNSNQEGVFAMPHLVEGGTIFSPIRCH